ncbi:putative protein kinase-like domain superfamily [Plasmopara halstedii]
MVKLFCVIVGKAGSAFPVTIDENETVGDLKKLIKAENSATITCDAKDLQLFLARKDGGWLTSFTIDVKKLKEGEKTALIEELTHKKKELQGESGLKKVLAGMLLPSTHEIHVLVVKGSANNLSDARQDSTDQWLTEFHTKKIEYLSLPPIASLPSFVRQPLPVKVRMKRKVLSRWSSFPGGPSMDVQDKMFAADDMAPCKKIKKKIESMLEPLRSEDTECSFIWFWDTVFRSILDVVFTRARINRDSSKNLSTENKRPDFLFILNDVCVFRGEEAEPGTNINLPREQLYQKLTWVYGAVPYVFGYAASGYKVDLFALFRSSSESSDVESYSIGYFDLESAADRFRIVLALLNLCLLFSAITEACPDSGRNEYRNIHCSNGVVGFDQLEHIYGIMQSANVSNVDRLIKLKWAKKTAIFEPRGTMMKPRNLLELFVALRNILEALVALHRESVIHRDIRCHKPQRFPNGKHLSTEEHAPEIFVNGSIHTTAVDIWAVGYLIETSGVRWDDLARRTAFAKRLMQKDPTRRPTAEHAFRDLKELQQEVMHEQPMMNNLQNTRIQTRKRRRGVLSKRKKGKR